MRKREQPRFTKCHFERSVTVYNFKGDLLQTQQAPFLSLVMYRRDYRTELFALGSDFKSAAAYKQGKDQYQATRVDIEIEILHFATATAQEQDYE